jgi:hypothetical protein
VTDKSIVKLIDGMIKDAAKFVGDDGPEAVSGWLSALLTLRVFITEGAEL